MEKMTIAVQSIKPDSANKILTCAVVATSARKLDSEPVASIMIVVRARTKKNETAAATKQRIREEVLGFLDVA